MRGAQSELSDAAARRGDGWDGAGGWPTRPHEVASVVEGEAVVRVGKSWIFVATLV